MRRVLPYIFFAVMMLFASAAVAQQAPPPGTSIDNQAQVQYPATAGTDSIFVSSNVVSAIIQSSLDLVMVPNYARESRVGLSETFTHRLTNTGNTPLDVIIRGVNASENEFSLDDIQLAPSEEQSLQNGSESTAGVQAAVQNQSQISDSLQVRLQPGEDFFFDVTARINDTAKPRQKATINVRATARQSDISLLNTDVLTVLEGPVLEVRKQQLGQNAVRGNTWSYGIAGENTGDQTALGTPVTINGSQQNKVVLVDPIPANTTFAAVEETGRGTPLYHTIGTPEHAYSTQLPADLSTIDKFAVAVDTLAPAEKIEAQFAVRINDNAAGRINNTALVNYRDPVDTESQMSEKASNSVLAELPESETELNYYTNDSYSDISRASRLGTPLLLQANAADCNVNFGAVDTTTINLVSQKTNDTEQFQSIETDFNTGYFRVLPNVPTRSADENEVVANNGILETVPNDVILASLPECSDQGMSITTEIAISPFGVVFDSQTGQTVQGAIVTLINTATGEVAQVFEESGSEQEPNPQTTGEDGVFRFPYVQPGSYQIQVQTPTGYIYTSEVPPAQLPQGRSVDPAGSYGEQFEVDGPPRPVAFDIPLDPDPNGQIFVEKTASVNDARIGDFVTYQITVTNNAAAVQSDVRVEDTLPFGLRYEEGTALLDGEPTDDPEGGSGPELTFNIGELEANASVQLTYRVLLGSGARNGEATNKAVAVSEGAITKTSNEARHTIDVRGGVFTDKGYVFGKVFADHNKNDVQDPGEPGVPGVRLYLENGSFVITDHRGMYTFYGINPNKHIVKLDNYSLPEGSRLRALDNRHAGDPSSRFVDLKNGQMHRADFAICDLTPAAEQELQDRRAQFMSSGTDELGNSVKRNFSADDNTSRRRVKRQQASGVVDGGELPSFKRAKGDSIATQPGAAPEVQFKAPNDTTVSHNITLEEAMVNTDVELGFIGLANNDTLYTSQATIWAKSKMGANIDLTVNGDTVAADRIGKRATLAPRNLQAFEYIGVALQPGSNTIVLTETDPFGNARGRREVNVVVPGRVSKIDVSVPVNDVPADGSSTAVVRVELQDEAGVPIKSRIPLTLDVSAGEWVVKDNDPATPGLQTFIEEGSRTFELKSTIEPQESTVRASVGTMQQESTVIFLPDLRPLIAAGIIEGTIRLNEGASVVPARSADGFERELKSLSYSTGNTTADARTAFFLKGKIKGNMLLTAGFDSEKDDDRLFRDIQPDEFYPVYGESSVKGYDAQSTSRLYVRVDHERTYALYGDFITQERHPAKSLGEYNRTQTGFKLHYEKDWVRLNAFGSQATSLQRIDEFRGQGISGPYELDSQNILLNSEQVELVTRDRNQPAVVIERERLQRFKDYVIEPFTGNLIFKRAVPSVDRELNPIFIRVTYEVEDGGDDYLIGGADGQLRVTDFWELGGSFVEDRSPDNNYRLTSANTSLRFGENTVLIGEVAQSTTELEGTGKGGRVELQHKGDNVDARLYAGQTDEDFVNRSSQLGRARTEAGARGNVELTNTTNLQADFIYSSNDTLNTRTAGGLLSVEQRLGDVLRAEVGFRYSKQNGARFGGVPDTTVSDDDITHKNIRGKLTVDVPKVEGASVFGEYEQDIKKNDRRLIAVGGDYNLKSIGKLYARHEFISSARGAYTLNSQTRRQNTVVGLEANYMQNGNVYSEYRVENAFDGENAQAAIGLRHRFELQEGLGINAGFERIFSVTGNPRNEGTAISAAVDYTGNPLWKGTARAEARFSRNGNRYLNTLGYGRKLNANWTFLGKNIFSLQTSSNAGASDRIQQRARLGLAYRQAEQNRWDGLGRYELKYEENGQFGGDFNRLVHIFSTNVNYHPASNWTHSGRLAAKKVAESSAEFDSESLTMLLSARTIYDISRKLDAGLNASIMSDAGFEGRDYGIGAEIGYIVQRNLRLAVGFNVFGFEDRDLAASSYTQKGVYVGFSYKFDERLFRGLMPEEDRNKRMYENCNDCVSLQPAQQTAGVLRMPEPELEFGGLQPVTLKARSLDVAKPEIWATLPNDIHFASNKHLLSESSEAMLNIVADFLRDQNQFKLVITGHTDSRASQQYNLNLSKRRARSVHQYLISKGVEVGLVEFRGMSENNQIVGQEEDIIDRARNRRVQLNLDIPTVNVRFIPQIADLQVEQNASGIGEWDYILNPRISAVPAGLTMKDEALNDVHRYLLDRLKIALEQYPQETVSLSVGGRNTRHTSSLIRNYLQKSGADMNRVMMKMRPAATAPATVQVQLNEDSKLYAVPQQDDQKFADNATVQPLLDKMLRVVDQYAGEFSKMKINSR